MYYEFKILRVESNVSKVQFKLVNSLLNLSWNVNSKLVTYILILESSLTYEIWDKSAWLISYKFSVSISVIV